MKPIKSKFALFFGTRGFFPASLISEARKQMKEVLNALGHEVIMMGETATQHGAVETMQEGRLYAAFLEQHRGKYDGVILCLPNFGDENGALEALKNVKEPILIQAYPDEMTKLSSKFRRDSFCGKMSIMDVFRQQNMKFVALKPHVVAPGTQDFARNIDYFDRLCSVFSGMRDMRLGALGARTSPFKTVRFDELALQRRGVTVETYDLAWIIDQVKGVDASSDRYRSKAAFMKNYATWKGVPEEAFVNICKLASVLDEVIEKDSLDCIAIRCWLELQMQLKVSPCVILSELNDRGIAAACEVDIGSAVTMRALSLAAKAVPACLDWNNNFDGDSEKCILFHCGPVPQSMMLEKGRVEDHQILETVLGKGCAFGCNVGRMKPSAMTYGNLLSEEGRLRMYMGEGEVTADPVPPEFFGTAGVVKIKNLQDVLLMIGSNGFRHHVGMAYGLVRDPLTEALEKYLGYDIIKV